MKKSAQFGAHIPGAETMNVDYWKTPGLIGRWERGAENSELASKVTSSFLANVIHSIENGLGRVSLL